MKIFIDVYGRIGVVSKFPNDEEHCGLQEMLFRYKGGWMKTARKNEVSLDKILVTAMAHYCDVLIAADI